jgi:hypothetical protein
LALINQRLLEAIAAKQGITVKGVYPQITKVVHETFLERDLAALVLATRHRININKHSTPAQAQRSEVIWWAAATITLIRRRPFLPRGQRDARAAREKERKGLKATPYSSCTAAIRRFANRCSTF